MVGQTTTIIYLNKLREIIDKELNHAKVGTNEVINLVIRDKAIRDTLNIVQGGELAEEKEINESIIIKQQKSIIDELMGENEALLKYRKLYWEYRDRVDRGN